VPNSTVQSAGPPQRYRAVALGPYAFAAAVPLVVFLPGAINDLAWSDDFFIFLSEDSNSESISNLVVGDGRPLYALLLLISSDMMSRTSDLMALRLFGIVGLSVAAILSLRVLVPRHQKNSYAFAAIVGTGFCLPTFHFYAHWSVTWPYSWAIVFSVAGWLLVVNYKSPTAWILGTLLVALSFSIYQAAGPFYFATIAVSFAVLDPWLPHFRRVAVLSLSLLAAGLVTYVLVALSTIGALGMNLNSKVTPVGIGDLSGNIVWFFTRHVVLAFQPFLVDRPGAVSLLLVALPLVLIILLFAILPTYTSHQLALSRLLYIGVFLVASSSPLLLSARQVEHRFIPGLAWGVFCLACVCMWNLVRMRGGLVLSRVFLVLLVVGGPLIASRITESNIQQLVVKPGVVRHQWVTSSLRECPSDSPVVVVLPEQGPWPKREKVGSFSEVSDMAQPWVVENAVRHAILNWRESSHEYDLRPSGSKEPHSCQLDLELLRLRFLAEVKASA